MYEEILPGVDLHYTIQSQRLKENIRLKTAQAAEQELIFHLRYTDMEMKKEEDGSLGLYSENQRIFWFDKPYMYDAKGCVSQNVELVMETEEGGCKVTVSAEKEWLLAEDRSYPVIIDPMTETSKTKTNIEDTYILQAERILRLTRVVFMHMDLLWQVSQLHLETAGHCSDSEICRTSEKVLSCMQRPCISGNMSIPVMESQNFRLLQMRS